MSHFSGFWNVFGFHHHHTSAQFEELINNPNCTVEQLLAEDSIVSEFRSSNHKLMDFCTNDKIKNIISYIIEEPSADADRDRGYKFPFTVSEILTTDNQVLMNAFLGKNPNHLKKGANQDDESGSDNEDYPRTDSNGDVELGTIKKPVEEKVDNQEEPENEGNEKQNQAEKTEEQNQDKTEPEAEGDTEKKVPATDDTTKTEPVAEPIKVENPGEEEKKKDEGAEEKEPESQFAVSHYFFSFLNNDELNITLVGYFGKVLNHLIVRKQTEFLEFLYGNVEYIYKLIKHIEHKIFADCVTKIIAFESDEPTHMEQRIEIVNKLLEKLLEEKERDLADSTANVCLVLSEILKNYSSISGGKELVKLLTKKESIDTTFKAMFSDPQKIQPIANYIITLANYYINLDLQSHEEEDSHIEGNLEDQPFFAALASNIDNIIDYIDGSNPLEAENIQTQYGKSIEPFGTARLRLVELLSYSIKLNHVKVNRELGLKKVFSKLMNLMKKYEWNNMLHNLIEKIFVFALEGDSHVLKKGLIEDSKLVNFLKEATLETQIPLGVTKSPKVRKGYLGHITRIATLMQKLMDREEKIKEALESDDWKTFERDYLVETLKSDNHDLAGYGSKKDSYDDNSSEDNVHFSNESIDKLSNLTVPSDNAADDVEEEIDDNTSPEKKEENELEYYESRDADWNPNDREEEGKDDNTSGHTTQETTSTNILEMMTHPQQTAFEKIEEHVYEGEYLDNQFWKQPLPNADFLAEFLQMNSDFSS